MAKSVYMISLGCPKNLVDSEIMLGNLTVEGYVIEKEPENADVIIVNTCSFIDSAKKESVDTILEMSSYKQKKCKKLIVAGCLVERYKDEIFNELPEVDAVIGTGNVEELVEIIKKSDAGVKAFEWDNLNSVEYLENKRMISTGKGYAYLKIAEGCDNFCTYCIIPKLRGKFRSRKIENILQEAVELSKQGVKEIILIAQDTTRYGIDIYGERKLVTLLQKLSEIQGIEWVRLLYCYPEEIDDNLIKEISKNEKVCKYIDMPIQHISDDILKAMGRRGTSKLIKDVINKLRKEIPNITIRTSLIAGFPNETVENFNDMYEFLKKFKLDHVGVFAYSKEEGTVAAKMKGQIHKKVKLNRQEQLMLRQREIVIQKNKNKINKIFKTIVENISDDGIFYFGRTEGIAPEIDGYIYFTSKEPLTAGEFVNVKVLNIDEFDLIGEVI